MIYYIVHAYLQRIAFFSHICQCPRDDQTHYNALYYFFCPLLFPTRIRPMSYIAIRTNFLRSAEIYKKRNNDDDNKNLEQQ